MAGQRPTSSSLRHLAVDIAQAAGRLLVEGRPEVLATTTKSTPTDVVTQMDRAAEDLIRSRILAERPDDGILGEEGGERSGASGVRWVVDPIDGTVNYLYGLPMWTVSIGVEVDGRTVAGVVEVPGLGLRYVAEAGAGAWAESASGTRPVRASAAAELPQALVATGFGYAADRRGEQGRHVARLLPLVRDIRRGGAASLDLCWVADGRVDAYFEEGLHPWDASAGALIAREAGARVIRLDGADLAAPGLPGAVVLASAPGIHDALHEMLGRIGVGRSPG